MNKVDEALETVTKYIENGGPLPPKDSPYWAASYSLEILAAEVRRLRDVPQDSPQDARELAIGFLRAVAGRFHEWIHRNMPGYTYGVIDYDKIFAPIDTSYIAQAIEAYATEKAQKYRARILDEAAERVERYLRCGIDTAYPGLRAAIKGEG